MDNIVIYAWPQNISWNATHLQFDSMLDKPKLKNVFRLTTNHSIIFMSFY